MFFVLYNKTKPVTFFQNEEFILNCVLSPTLLAEKKMLASQNQITQGV